MADNILIVDGDSSFCHTLSSMLADYNCGEAKDWVQALALLDSGKKFDLVIFKLGKADSRSELMGDIQNKYPLIPLVVMTAVQNISVALTAVRNGAYDYVLMPIATNQLLTVVGRALEHPRVKLGATEQLRRPDSQTERSHDLALDALGHALALKDAGTEQHCKRVAAYSICIARAMHMPQERIRGLTRGAYLHDVGMMSVPDAVLRKPGALNPSEFAMVKEHCVQGYAMVSKIPSLEEAAEIVYSHHERFDGTGYPRGLRGAEIPLGARIVAVANTLDAITSERCYRPAQSMAAARAEIQSGAGTHFDPEIASILVQIADQTFTNLRQAIETEIYKH